MPPKGSKSFSFYRNATVIPFAISSCRRMTRDVIAE
jgi:hypothetical protein